MTLNDPPVSLPTLEIQPSGCEVVRKATMKDAETTMGNEITVLYMQWYGNEFVLFQEEKKET